MNLLGQLHGALFTFMGSKFISDLDNCLHKFKIASCKIAVNDAFFRSIRQAV